MRTMAVEMRSEKTRGKSMMQSATQAARQQYMYIFFLSSGPTNCI